MTDNEQLNLPGWSFSRDSPRPQSKQGWECPVPTVQDWEDYQNWKTQQEKKDELPAAPQVYLADTSLLFYRDPDVKLPWIHRLKCELPRRVGRLSGELPVKASYIGFGHMDDTAGYQIFKEAMAQIGITGCRQIHHPANRFEIAHLEQSDLVLVSGGDRKRLWETLGTDVVGSQVAEHVKWRYLQGALVIAVGEAVSLVGEKSWYVMDGGHVVPFTGWNIFPHIVALEDEDGVDLEDMVATLGGPKVVILGLSKGGGMIFNKDGLVEPVRHMVQEYRWDWRCEGVKRALLLGPPRGTGLVCPLYAVMQEREQDDVEEQDVYTFSLSADEEKEEETLAEVFEGNLGMWLTVEARKELLAIKSEGNNAMKGGQASLASLRYTQARAQLESKAVLWSELQDEERRELEALCNKGSTSEYEDHRASAFAVPLLLNICAARLALFEEAKGCTANADNKQQALNRAEEARSDKEASSGEALATERPELAVMESSDDLGVAFVVANEALKLTSGQLAKAWYRRGCVFAAMSDARNALRDFDEALLRCPGDQAVKAKRASIAESAAVVAENMYYARHRELDKELERAQLKERRALAFSGSFSDSFKDATGSYAFAVAQPLAWLVEVDVQDVDGVLKSQPLERGRDARLAYLHPHALWTWEFIVQTALHLQYLSVENVDLGSGPLEWLCKGLRTHHEVRVCRFVGCHIGPSGAKMLRNVLAQNSSLSELVVDSCGLHDAGIDEVSAGLVDHQGSLAVLSLRQNYVTFKPLGRLSRAMSRDGAALTLADLDLSGNSLGLAGAKELGVLVAADAGSLRVLRLQHCAIDCCAFWRLVGNLKDGHGLATLDLCCNPIGRGTRRLWKRTAAPTSRCQVLLSGDPRRARQEYLNAWVIDTDSRGFPLPMAWV